MSTNYKNIIRPEILKNYTKKIKERYVLLKKGSCEFNDIEYVVSSVNRDINLIIQELNLKIKDRQLPYITLKICYGDIINKRVRVFIHNDDTEYLYERDVKAQIESEDEISHILDVLIASSLKIITISNLSCDAELVIDYELLKSAIIDILLDIVMFNSYSFLKKMSIIEKKEFSGKKYDFFVDEKLPCFYNCPEDKLLYYSLSFSARKEDNKFNIDDYIGYWNSFIDKYYPTYSHKEKSMIEQIKQHVDYEQLPKNILSKFDEYPDGAYLILRTNKGRTDSLQPRIKELFGRKKIREGLIKIVPIDDFYKHKELFINLDVSVYKVIKQSNLE
ncbi:MAG: hypothetical protein IKJ73_03130 [Lachnospiraceae bacterium]|nr:hypothetical protein [Lachnospiraceae bacterium]